MHRDIGARSPRRVDRHVEVRACRHDVDVACRPHPIGDHQQRRRAVEGHGNMHVRGVAGRVMGAVAGHHRGVRNVRVRRPAPARGEAHRRRRETARLRHLQPVAAEIELPADMQGAAGGDRDLAVFQRLVAPDGLERRQRALRHQPPIRPLPHQPEMSREPDALLVGIDRRDVEAGLGPGIHGILERRLDADQRTGRPHRQVGMRAGAVAGRIVHHHVDMRLHRMGAVWCRLEQQGQAGQALGVGRRQIGLLRRRRKLLVHQADRVAGEGRRRCRRDIQADRRGAAQVGGGCSVEEAGGDRHLHRRAGHQGGRHGAERHRHAVRNERVDLELRRADRRLLRVGQQLGGPHA